ncbi:MAG TPA: AAA family ATPase [Gemmatimonadales bacterium]|nr:AAA family ATPase [Gemmatimonadales bacterium]
MIRCQTLGPPLARLDDGSAPAILQWRKNLALLVYLARSPKRTRAREHLMGLFWGDQPDEKARGSLKEAVRTLRSYVRDGVESDRTRVRLGEGAVALDVEEFDALAGAGDETAAARLVVGLFLEGFSIPGASGFDDWMSAERRHWQRRSVDVLVGLSTKGAAAGDLSTAEGAARRALQLDEHSELALRALMRALELGGNRASALAELAAFTERLKRDVGSEPDAETRALAERIRRAPRAPSEGVSTPDTGPASRRAPLVGRASELQRLVAAWAAARQGHLGVTVVEGDGGTGKTRLAEELASRARLDGAAIAAIRAVEADRTDAWSGILNIAQAGLLSAPGVAAASPAALAQLRGNAPPESGTRAFSEALRVVADEQPVLIVVDDAHWLDRESLLTLGAVARDLTTSPVLLLFTTSPHLKRDELDELRARIGREVSGTAVTLAPLGEEALRALAQWAAPAYDQIQLERLVRRVLADSAGIPLLAVELLNAVAIGLDLQYLQGAWPEPFRTLQQTLPGGLPDAITAAIRVNFHRLSGDAQGVLVAAAVLGERVRPAVLERASGVTGLRLAIALDELEWQRWLTAEPRGYTFAARIVRDVVDRDMVVPGQRQRILEAAKQPPGHA